MTFFAGFIFGAITFGWLVALCHSYRAGEQWEIECKRADFWYEQFIDLVRRLDEQEVEQ